jgi:hypothetical protein
MLRIIRGIKKILINLPWYWQKSFNTYASKGKSKLKKEEPQVEK